MKILGLDTSNYTTSCALLNTETGELVQKKERLPVAAGQKGLRQSDAVFHHTRQLPTLMEQLFAETSAGNLDAIGVSSAPREGKDSYMPCFLCGGAAARILSAVQRIPLHETTHQMGHILAALWSAGKMDWLEASHQPFLAFHVSGGTTDCLLCTPHSEDALQLTPVASSLDLKAGQAVDRVGVMLGLSFPCGEELERLAARSQTRASMRVTLKDGCCSFSGLQNQCETMLRQGLPREEIARYCLNSISNAISAMTKDAASRFAVSSVIFAGGVLSDRLIQNQLAVLPLETAFADADFSCDNAAGTAIFAACKEGFSWHP